MTRQRRGLVALVSIAIAVAFVIGIRARIPMDGERRFGVQGTVVDQQAGSVVTIAHEAVADYMPAMTMPFVLADPGQSPRLTPGDRVRFRLRVTGERAVIDRIEVTGREPGRARLAHVRPAAARLKTGDAVPPFRLLDQGHQTVTEADLLGRLTIVTFVFTRCPMPEFCPRVMARFREIQAALEGDPMLERHVRLLGVTLDPEFDSPEVLAAYGRANHANTSLWRFATGQPAEVAGLTRAFAVYSERSGVSLDHALATALIDERGRVAAVWRGNRWTSDEVLAVLRAARR